jgi:pSer/pThr/pTyr-binding forkhead associated (FHA) protein
MMSSTRVLRGLVLGALGGVLGWLIVEPVPYLTTDNIQSVDWTAIAILGAIVGAGIGAALGVAEGIVAGTAPKFKRAVMMGALVGAAGGCLGLWIGQAFYGGILAMFRITTQEPRTPFEFFLHLIARTLGWTLLGMLVGLSVGVPTQSTRKMRHGFIGGMFGGAIGGFSFQTLAMISQSLPLFDGPVLRLIGFTSIGGATGFFVSLVAEAFKQAWVRVLVGRNEGREHILDKPENVIGRDELAEVPVFGDMSVARRHAAILQANGRHVLRDEGAPGGTQVNGQPVAQHLLQDGDQITVGRVAMVFYEKASASPHRRPVDVARSPINPRPSLGANVCPYCGMAKDPLTGACACSVSADTDPSEIPLGTVPWGPVDASPGGPRLVVLAGPYAGSEFPIPPGQTTIGREPSQDVALVGDPTTSRRHAVILHDNGRCVIRDEGSSNGTLVNGAQVTEHPLSPGDVIQVGGNQLRYEE